MTQRFQDLLYVCVALVNQNEERAVTRGFFPPRSQNWYAKLQRIPITLLFISWQSIVPGMGRWSGMKPRQTFFRAVRYGNAATRGQDGQW